MFEIGATYQFTMTEGDDRLYTYARVIEWQHPLVHIETEDGKRQILNLSNSTFSGAKPWGATGALKMPPGGMGSIRPVDGS
ncbi:MAG: hypothetical protein Devi2KO_04240 [Devosia indica]